MRSKTSLEGLVAFGVGLLAAGAIVAGARLINTTSAIQQQRHDLCTAQDHRHDNTLKALNATIPSDESDVYVRLFTAAGLHLTPASKAALRAFVQQQLKSQQASTLLVVNALAPYQDCSKIG